jgi:hypothetical protein
MSSIGADFDEAKRIIAGFRRASVEVDTEMSVSPPRDINGGDASEVVLALVMGLMDCGAQLSLYGQGLAAVADAGLEDLRAFNAQLAEELLGAGLAPEDDGV